MSKKDLIDAVAEATELSKDKAGVAVEAGRRSGRAGRPHRPVPRVQPDRLLASLLEQGTGRLWIQARRPDLYGELTVPTGRERDAHRLKFEE